MNNDAPLLAIVGETASGKTSVAIDIAKKVNGEILCADSRTVYKQMDIGTAKPTIAEQDGVPHHLLNIIEPNDDFSVAQFQSLAQKCIRDVQGRGKVPIIVGGSGLYVDVVLYNFHFPKPGGRYTREILEQMNDVELTTLLEEESLDGGTLNTKNRRHVINALLRLGATGSRDNLPPNAMILGIKLDRAVLLNRIEKRVEKMFDDGVIDEVANIADQYGWDHESMSGIGYRLAHQHIEGTATINEVKEAFVRRDMSLAKRQRTWFKRNPDIVWCESPGVLFDKAVEFVEQFNYNKS